MSKIDDTLIKLIAHPKVGPVLEKIATADKKEVEKFNIALATIAISYSSRICVNRALRDFGFEKKQARRLTYAAVCAAYLLGSNFRAGVNSADKVAALKT